MQKFLEFFQRWIPSRFSHRRYLLDQYHFDLTSFEGDASEWLNRFPVNDQNVEIYFALAELFRRRGEFDKAVTIHEAISNSSITNHSYSEIILEIAQDYYAAGLLSHAEDLLVKALEQADDDIAKQAFRLWLTILESEQEWGRAVELVEQYGIPGSGGVRLANLYCEHVEHQRRHKPASMLKKSLKKAFKLGVSARTDLLMAELSVELNQLDDAIQFYRDLLLRDPKRINLVVTSLKQLSFLTESQVHLTRFLKQIYARHPSVRLLEALLEAQAATAEPVSIELQSWIDYQVKQGDSYTVINYWLQAQAPETREAVKPLMVAFRDRSLTEVDQHICVECGFHSDKMVWQCPQCSAWETLYSQYELKIEQKIKRAT